MRMLTIPVISVELIELDTPCPVCDLTAERNSNFCLASGEVVHNSKDMADAVAATLHVLMRKASGNVKGRQSIHDTVSRESFAEKRERPTANRRSRFSTV